MAYINKSRRTGTLEQVISRHEDGSILQGEADMFERIQHDCESSSLNWYVWYDLSLPIAFAGKSEIQIDFLLVCEKGAIVLEVKGGRIDVIDGRYYYVGRNGQMTAMKITPFDQAYHYKWALLNNNVLNRDKLFVEYVVAFPHQTMTMTNKNGNLDQSFWLWDKSYHETNASFADFCENILDSARANSTIGDYIKPLKKSELESTVVNELSPTFVDKSRYAQSSLAEVLNWLHIENLDVLEGLSRNKRIIIEGGPGTGKTTMAKAFIKRHNGLKGLYLCQNILLQAKIKKELVQEDLYNCTVDTFGRFINSLSDNCNYDQSEISPTIVRELLLQHGHQFYDYVIIDEAQDIADKGIDMLLNSLTSINDDGLATGTYLVFYDIEQGFNSSSRRIENLISDLMVNATHYKLNENKRVITNKEIVLLANQLLEIEQTKYGEFMNSLREIDRPYLNVIMATNNKELSRAFKFAVKQSSDTDKTVVLVHSAFKHIASKLDEGMSIYDSLTCKPSVHILDENDIANPDMSSVPLTTILKYKGLETNKIILIIPDKCYSGSYDNFLFEVYVGFTRAMMELQIIIFSN